MWGALSVALPAAARCVVVGGVWWFVENCIVDASILLCGQVCKGRRVDALAPGADEGRGRPR